MLRAAEGALSPRYDSSEAGDSGVSGTIRIAAQCLARHRLAQSGSLCIREFLGHSASLAAWRYPASQLIGTSAFGEKLSWKEISVTVDAVKAAPRLKAQRTRRW